MTSFIGLTAVSASADLISGWGLESGAQNAILTETEPGSFSVTAPTGNTAPRADFSPVDFSSIGDAVEFSGTVQLAATFGNDQFRFGLYNNNGQSTGTLSDGLWSGSTDTGWLGYIVEPRNAGGSGATVMDGLNGSGSHPWFSTTGDVYTPTANPGETFSGAYTTAPGTFDFTLTLDRLTATSVGIAYSFVETDGTGNYSATGNYTDDGGLSSGISSFNAVGFLLTTSSGGAASFSDITVAPVPEPSTLALIGLGLGGFGLLVRRRQT